VVRESGTFSNEGRYWFAGDSGKEAEKR